MIFALTWVAIASILATLARRTHPISRCLTLVVVAGYLPMTRLHLGNIHVVARCGAVALLSLVALLLFTDPPDRARSRTRRTDARFVYEPIAVLPFIGVIGLASVVWSLYPLGTLINGLYSIALFAVLSMLVRRRWRLGDGCDEDVLAMLLPLALIMFWGAISDIIGASYVWSGGRRAGLLTNPNAIGHVGAMAAAMAWYLHRRQVIRRSRFIACVALSTYAIVVSQSRAALVGVLATVLIVVLSSRRSSNIAIALLTVGLLAGGISLVVALDQVPALSGVAARFSNDEGVAAVASRADLRTAALRTWEDRPIVGFGYGATTTAMTEIDRLDAARNGSLAVHNGYVQLLLELGLLGFVPTVAILGHVLVGSFGPLGGRPAAALHGGAVGIATMSLVESTLLSPMLITSSLLWVMAAMAWAQSNADEIDALDLTHLDATSPGGAGGMRGGGMGGGGNGDGGPPDDPAGPMSPTPTTVDLTRLDRSTAESADELVGASDTDSPAPFARAPLVQTRSSDDTATHDAETPADDIG